MLYTMRHDCPACGAYQQCCQEYPDEHQSWEFKCHNCGAVYYIDIKEKK